MTSAAHDLRSPCRGCGLLESDKNGPTCLQCPQRLDYVRALGGHLPGDGGHVDPDPAPVPPAPGVGRTNKRYTPWSKDEIDFLRDNAPHLTDIQIGHELGRSASSVQKMRSDNGIYRVWEATTMTVTKICKGCGKSRPLEDFPVTKQNRDGHGGKCKECKNEYLRDWYKNSIAKPTADPQPIRERERERERERKKERDPGGPPVPAAITAEVHGSLIVFTIDCSAIMDDLRAVITASKRRNTNDEHA